ncbi:MAG: hypothetical protein K9M07_05255 [Simkaniaceae bacterium]|nr:hypothetical protein [Simkaniaceae bacterium]
MTSILRSLENWFSGKIYEDDASSPKGTASSKEATVIIPGNEEIKCPSTDLDANASFFIALPDGKYVMVASSHLWGKVFTSSLKLGDREISILPTLDSVNGYAALERIDYEKLGFVKVNGYFAYRYTLSETSDAKASS